ncbi:MAG: hypothetical protein ACRDHW_04185, partial [Ktedonobacteraceae bacterium]
TTVIRVEERRCAGHKFLLADPHWFKPDSLINALESYREDFLMPAGRSAEEILQVLDAFLAEFQARKGGEVAQPWQPVTLIVDEVGSLIDRAAVSTDEEKAIIAILPSIARICGQEARNFQMGGIFISQQATGLAWLRKVSTMVIVHQLLMESEKRLACNYDAAVMDAMKRWPIGRTYIYGVGFGQEGPLTVQQPYFGQSAIAGVDGDDEPDEWEYEMERLQPARRSEVLTPAIVESDLVGESETNPETVLSEEERQALVLVDNGAGPREIERSLDVTYYHARQLWKICQEYRADLPMESESSESVEAD